MTPFVLASLLTLMLLAAWHLGRVVEWLLPRFPALARRLTFTFLAYELVRIPVERLLRVLL